MPLRVPESFRAALCGLALAALLVPHATVAEPSMREAPGGSLPDLPPSLHGAPIALMIDLGSGRVLFSRDPDRRFMPASLTKLMTIYTAFEMLQEGTLQPEQRMPVSDAAFHDWARKGSSMFLARGTSASVDDLLRAIPTVSANDGCIVLAEGAAGSVAAFTDLMNAKARELGMNDSHFGTPNGWPDEGRTFTTAHDLTVLAQALITRHPRKYRRYFSIPEFTWSEITQKNRNPILGVVKGADGLKTGFTNEAGYGFVGSAERGGRRVIMVIAGTESAQARKRIARDFITWAFDAWQASRLYGGGDTVAEVAVQGGADRHLPLRTDRPVFATVPKGAVTGARISVRYLGPAEAPIKEGEQVASLVIDTKDGGRSSVPLTATHDVAKANWWQRIRNGLFALVP